MTTRVMLQRQPNVDAFELFIFRYTNNETTEILTTSGMIVLGEDERIFPSLTIPGPLWEGSLQKQLQELLGPSPDAAAQGVLREWLDRERAVVDEYRRELT